MHLVEGRKHYGRYDPILAIIDTFPAAIVDIPAAFSPAHEDVSAKRGSSGNPRNALFGDNGQWTLCFQYAYESCGNRRLPVRSCCISPCLKRSLATIRSLNWRIPRSQVERTAEMACCSIAGGRSSGKAATSDFVIFGIFTTTASETFPMVYLTVEPVLHVFWTCQLWVE